MKATAEDIKKIISEAIPLFNSDSIVSDIPIGHQGVDSLDLTSIYFLLEDKFGIKIPDEDMNQVQTIDAIVKYFNNKVD